VSSQTNDKSDKKNSKSKKKANEDSENEHADMSSDDDMGYNIKKKPARTKKDTVKKEVIKKEVSKNKTTKKLDSIVSKKSSEVDNSTSKTLKRKRDILDFEKELNNEEEYENLSGLVSDEEEDEYNDNGKMVLESDEEADANDNESQDAYEFED